MPNVEKKEELRDLLVSVSENDDYAFRVFYDLYYRSVFRFVYYFLRNRDACREVVSNVFVSVWMSRVALREVINVDAYLYIVARNEAQRFLKKKSRADRRCLSLEEIPISFGDRSVPSPSDSRDAESPDRFLIETELEAEVRRLVNDLPDRCRTIFLLSRSEGLSTREIARALSLSESTVRVQIKNAVDSIIAGLRESYPDLKLMYLLLLLFSGTFSF